MIFKHMLKKGCQCEDWIHPCQDRVQWRALVNPVRIEFSGGALANPTINLLGLLEARNFLTG
jgi:hypothetical protein